MMFDVNKSLAECPPEIYYSQLGVDGKPLFPGIHHKKRIVLNRSLVTFRDEDQIMKPHVFVILISKLNILAVSLLIKKMKAPLGGGAFSFLFIILM